MRQETRLPGRIRQGRAESPAQIAGATVRQLDRPVACSPLVGRAGGAPGGHPAAPGEIARSVGQHVLDGHVARSELSPRSESNRRHTADKEHR